MNTCPQCAELQGSPSHVTSRDGLTLVGIGQFCGVVALEHYRCERCKLVLSRQFAGDRCDQVWKAIYRSESGARLGSSR